MNYNNYKKMTTTELGRYGEDIAVKYLRDKGFRILERNFRYSHRELDIIADDATNLIFVEVKARTNHNNELYHYKHRPGDAVNLTKQRFIISAARHYMRTHDTHHKYPRLDVIEIYFSPYQRFGKPVIERVHHIENAFWPH